MICTECKRSFPGDLLSPVQLGDAMRIVCAICGHKLLCQHFRLDPETNPLAGKGAELYRKTVEYLRSSAEGEPDWIGRWFAAMPPEWQQGLHIAMKGGAWVGDFKGEDGTTVCVVFVHSKHMPKIERVL